MPSNYPTSLDSFSTSFADATVAASTHPTHHNDISDAINKIEAELGVSPSGSFTTLVQRLNASSTVRKSADQTNSTTTLTNVTDLFFPVTINADHFFEFYIPYSAAATTTGVGFAITVPALASGGYISYMVEISGRAANPAVGGAMALTTVPYHVHGAASGGGTANASESVAVINTVYMARIHGILSNPSAAGNIQVQHRSEVAAASTVKKGAFGRMYVN